MKELSQLHPAQSRSVPDLSMPSKSIPQSGTDVIIDRSHILSLLRETDEETLQTLWRNADRVRFEHVGDEVHLRGLVEFSNYCVRQCAYCGIREANTKPTRYRMSADQIIECARRSVSYGYGTLVLQSGEDIGFSAEWLATVVRRIKEETPLAVTLSVGEREESEYALWRRAGADRYLLRFETSNRALYEKIHPRRQGRVSDRPAILRMLRDLGYEIGSGVMIGIPGQTWEILADDIMLFRELDLDMIGVGPYISHPETPLGQHSADFYASDESQVPATELMTYKVIALSRLACPNANFPSTTALATLNTAEGRELGLSRGANVVMPNVTPPEFRAHYEIYPSKACIDETAEQCYHCMRNRILSIGRIPGSGRGDSRRHIIARSSV